MAEDKLQRRIKFYRSPVPAADLARLNQRSDAKGMAQTLAFLAVLIITGALAWYSVGRTHWLIVIALIYLYGSLQKFTVNGHHEFCHKTVFKTQALNEIFVHIFSFLGWFSHISFWASHQAHHRYTLHPPDDSEVVLPVKFTLKSYLGFAFINVRGFFLRMRHTLRLCFGIIEDDWEQVLFPARKQEGQASALQLGARPHHRSRADRCDLRLDRLVDARRAGDLLVLLRRRFSISIECRAAYRLDRQHARLPHKYAHHRPQSDIGFPLLADELPHRASHVRRCALLQLARIAPDREARHARALSGNHWHLAADHPDPAAPADRAGLPVRAGIADSSKNLAPCHHIAAYEGIGRFRAETCGLLSAIRLRRARILRRANDR